MIPAELLPLGQWVVWRYEFRHGKWTKIPYNPMHPGSRAKAGDPSTWGTFDAAWAAYLAGGWDGIGFEFADDDPYFGADIDHCLKDGEIATWAAPIVSRLEATYGEISPSGGGIKFIGKGRISDEARNLLTGKKTGTRRPGLGPDKSGALEIYDRGRFFAITGNVFGDRTEILELPGVADELLRLAKAGPGCDEPSPSAVLHGNGQAAPLFDASDDELLRRARAARNGEKFTALFDRGDTSEYKDDDSAADLALADMLAFWTCRDASRMEVLFGRSALGQREKWQRADYRKRTIDRAIADCTAVYSPAHPPGGNGRPSVATADDHGDVNEGPEDPHRLARLHLARVRHIRFYRGEWLQHDGSAYRAVKDSELHSGLAGTIKREFNRLNRGALKFWEEEVQANADGDGDGKPRKKPETRPREKPEARKVTRTLVSNATLALQSMTLLPGKTEAPSWLGSKAPFPPGEVVPARNVLIHLPTLRTVRSTADFFATYALEFDFNAAAPEPGEWLTFLDSLWDDDRQSIDTLQEFYGYCLAPDTRQQKILSLIGPKRAGKDTIARVLTHLVGVENTAGPTLASLAGDFGLAPLIGKPLAIISDARITRGTNTGVIVERLLTISGEGLVTIDRKYLETWTGKLPTRFVLISNELPRLADASAALAGRLILLRLTRSFYGSEDLGLFDRLIPELPGIFLWAHKGWLRLRERGYFVQPQSGGDLIENLEELSSPVLAFVRERCKTEAPALEIECKLLFDEWCEWCKATGWKPGTPQSFAKDLRAACPLVSTKRTMVGGREGKIVRFYKGIELTTEF
jgi:P4 family phage/plasmid primase-like protien